MRFLGFGNFEKFFQGVRYKIILTTCFLDIILSDSNDDLERLQLDIVSQRGSWALREWPVRTSPVLVEQKDYSDNPKHQKSK